MVITPDQILDLIAEEAPVGRDKLDPEATLDSLGIASLDVISVLFTLEDRYGVIVEQEDVKDARTLRDFVDAVIAKAAAV